MHSYFQIGFFVLITATLFISCKSKQYTFDTYKGKRLAIGSSGGFTGATIKYYLFENGQIFKNGKSGREELPKIDKNVMKQQFDNYYKLGFDKLEINESGNMSYFIIMNPDTENMQILKWGGGSVEPGKELEQYYNLLSAIIKNNSSPNTKEYTR